MVSYMSSSTGCGDVVSNKFHFQTIVVFSDKALLSYRSYLSEHGTTVDDDNYTTFQFLYPLTHRSMTVPGCCRDCYHMRRFP